MHLCVCSAAQLCTARPYKPASAFWDCAHRSPPDWAHTRPHLHRDQVHPPHQQLDWVDPLPTSALRKRLSQPTSAPQPNPSPADICATTAALRDICLCATQAWRSSAARYVATTCAALQSSATCARSRCGRHMLQPATCCNRLHAAALPCHWRHPIRSKQAKRRRRWLNRVACARQCGRGLASTKARPCV
jgi:hypothetical protein